MNHEQELNLLNRRLNGRLRDTLLSLEHAENGDLMTAAEYAAEKAGKPVPKHKRRYQTLTDDEILRAFQRKV